MNEFSILYIEDDKLTQNIINSVLGKKFSKIFLANDGVEGIKLYHEKNPDIILSDISMPKMNGIEMTKKIKKIDPTQKIALFTGYNQIEYLNKAINVGVDKYILKPLDTKQMFEALEDIVISLKREKEEKEEQKKLEFIAQHDALTGLLNRGQFFSLLNKLRYRSDREKCMIAILAVDLNKFKPINDTYGHEAGDMVLKHVAKTFLQATRKEDLVARFGGDEFGIAIGYVKEDKEILKFIERIEEGLKKPLLYVDDDGIKHNIDIGCSIGIAFHLHNALESDFEMLMRQADKAMYSAKSQKKFYAFFDAVEESKFKLKLQKSIEIKKGIDRGEFLLYFQPIIDIKKQKVISFESLIRWQHPIDGILTPNNFLPYILDNEEMITYLGKWVIESVFIQYEDWLKKGHDILLSVNISFNELLSIDFISMLKSFLKKYPSVKASQIIFEVVENIALKDMGLDASALNEVKKLGFKIALDNFGTGLATLSSIKQFKIDSIKIDKSFVINMLKNKEDRAIVNAAIQLAKAFDYVVIAEGVESKAHLPVLLEFGCDRAQGFGIARPMPSEEVELLFF